MAKETKMDRFKINNRSMKSLEQSWMRTKSKSFEDYKKAMDLRPTPQTILYMDKEGNIAYWHGNLFNKTKKLNWSKVMDGTTATTQWKGLHDVLETVHSYNPENGWLQNCNSTPYSVAGVNSQENYHHIWLLTAKVLEDSMLYAY
jgi:acyl-homoserine lactone acylase PvdQ